MSVATKSTDLLIPMQGSLLDELIVAYKPPAVFESEAETVLS